MAQRTRSFPFRTGGDSLGTYNGSPTNMPIYVGLNKCVDETHPGPPYRSGGPLNIAKFAVYLGFSQSIYASRTPSGNPPGYYSGRFAAYPYIPPSPPTGRSLSGWGAIGWNRTFPTHPIYSMGVSLLEMKDAPDMVSHTYRAFGDFARRGFSFSATRRTVGDFLNDLKKGPKYIADNYLNTQFGWVPFMGDLAAMMNYRENLLKKLNWLRKHNGKSVRRRITLDAGGFSEAVSTASQSQFLSMAPLIPLAAYYTSNNGSRPRDITKIYDSKIWYVAKYRFLIPELANRRALRLDEHRRLASSLYGLDLDPSIIYKVIPWSWLIDWFVNIGAVLQNVYLRARYQVVAEYAYVMCSEKYTYLHKGWCSVHTGKYNQTTNTWSGADTVVSGTTKTQYVFRQREVANPYGFGITFKSLSAYQWSILVALGLSRRSKSSAPRS